MNEYTLQFGNNNQLAGIIIEPPGHWRPVGCVLLTGGLAPKFGSFRMHTPLARSIAELGFPVLRFDLGGIGDSGHCIRGVPLDERTQLELGMAIDAFARQCGIEKFALVGTCSGAEAAFRCAETDSRIVGVSMIDPFAYSTAGWAWRNFRFRLYRYFLRKLGLYSALGSSDSTQSAPAEYAHLVDYEYMTPDESARILKNVLERNLQLQFIYSGSTRHRFNHRGQFRKMFPGIDLREHVQVDYLPHCEHSPMLIRERDELIQSITRHLSSSYPAS